MEDGDCKTKFFHRVANVRRKFDAIKNIGVEGELHFDDSSVKGAVVHFYEKIYHENFPSRPFLEGIFYSSISLDDAMELEKDFFDKEVWKAVNDLGKKKVPGQMVSILPFFSIAGVLSRENYGFICIFS